MGGARRSTATLVAKRENLDVLGGVGRASSQLNTRVSIRYPIERRRDPARRPASRGPAIRPAAKALSGTVDAFWRPHAELVFRSFC